MCGPPVCWICEDKFFSKLRRDRLRQVWVILWVPLVVLWLIYVGFSLEKLATAEEGQSFQVQLVLREPIFLPAWTICGDTRNGIVESTLHCTLDGQPTPIKFKSYDDGCYGFNDLNQNLKAGLKQGSVNCVVGFIDQNQTARVFVHDQKYSADIHDRHSGDSIYDILKLIPSGICTEGLEVNGHTYMWWKKSSFDYIKGGLVNGFERIDSYITRGRTLEAVPNSGLLTLEVGDYYEWRFKQVQWYSGYDLWYFLGMVGGLSFLVVLLHALFFYPLKRYMFYMIPEEMAQSSLEEGVEQPLTRHREMRYMDDHSYTPTSSSTTYTPTSTSTSASSGLASASGPTSEETPNTSSQYDTH
jgi:hypothetical protein